MKKIIVSLLAGVLAVSAAVCVSAEEKHFTIATDTVFKPFEYTDANGEFVGIGSNLNGLDIALHVAGKAAGHTGEDEAYTLGAAGVRDGRETAHHDDVGIAESLGNTLGHVEAMAGAGVTVDDVFAHIDSPSKKIIILSIRQ